MADRIMSLKIMGSSSFGNEYPIGTTASNVDITINNAASNVDTVIKNIVSGTQSVGNAAKVNGHTVNSDVPANAKFTDTVTTVDSSLSSSSTNPVQNKIVKNSLDDKLSLSNGGTVSGDLIVNNFTIADSIQPVVFGSKVHAIFKTFYSKKSKLYYDNETQSIDMEWAIKPIYEYNGNIYYIANTNVWMPLSFPNIWDSNGGKTAVSNTFYFDYPLTFSNQYVFSSVSLIASDYKAYLITADNSFSRSRSSKYQFCSDTVTSVKKHCILSIGILGFLNTSSS